MRKHFLIYGAILLLVGAVLLGVLLHSNVYRLSQKDQSSNNALPSQSGSASMQQGKATASPENPFPSPKPGSTDGVAARNLLKNFLNRVGAKEMPPAETYLRREIASGDKSRILRAFDDAAYSQYWGTGETVSALKLFLNDGNPFVRFLAARDLFIEGDNAGFQTLLAMVQSTDPIDGIGKDLRIAAAEILAQFRQTDAVRAIANLYSETRSGDVSRSLAALGVQLPGENELPFVPSQLAIEEYAKSGATRFIPEIASLFSNTKDSQLQMTAAWALATMTKDQNAINYLLQAGQAVIDGKTTFGDDRMAIEYLGSIQDPRVKPILEAAIYSTNSSIAEPAAVNLVFNQGGSSKVNALVSSTFYGTPATLSLDLALNLAPQLLTDPQIQAAGQYFSQHDGSGAWQRYTVGRKDWPVYDWIDNYVVTLSR